MEHAICGREGGIEGGGGKGEEPALAYCADDAGPQERPVPASANLDNIIGFGFRVCFSSSNVRRQSEWTLSRTRRLYLARLSPEMCGSAVVRRLSPVSMSGTNQATIQITWQSN